MKASSRAMLLSGLVYPGLGQMLLRRRFSGLLFLLGTTAAFVVLIYCLVQRAVHVMDEAMSKLVNNSLDLQALKELIERISAGSWRVENICLIVILVCWLAAIAHAYFVGNKIDSQPRSPSNQIY